MICRPPIKTIERLENELSWLKRQVFGRKEDAVPPPPRPEVKDLFAGWLPKAQDAL